jgi:nitrite reductase (NO-forming)
MSALAAILVVLAGGCSQRGEPGEARNLTLGGPPAKITFNEPRSATPFSGPGVSLAPEVKPAPDSTSVHVHFDVMHVKTRVADGVEYIAWTFGGVVPGPVIHVRQGTRVHFSLTNRSDETASVSPPMPHSIIPAAGGAIVEFVVPEDGIYTFLDHEFADAEMGAAGHISTLVP